MFQSARIKLTAWYLLIIMVISISFSVAIYRTLVLEVDRMERSQRIRLERWALEELPQNHETPNGNQPPYLDPTLITEIKYRIEVTLIIINGIIIVLTAFGGYFLAGKTLRPIQEMLERQNTFITDASHELRTPLTAMKSEIEVGLRDRNLTEKDMKDLLQSNLEEVDNLQLLTDNLIKLTRYEAGNQSPVTDTVLVRDILAKAIKTVKKSATDKQITIRTKVKQESVHGNPSMITELYIILLDNAIKYSKTKTEITVEVKRIDGKVQISVADQGIGIEEKDIPHLFDRFYRVDTARTKSTVGYGLGLSIAKEIVEYHHGSIHVESIVHHGSTFIVLLPV